MKSPAITKKRHCLVCHHPKLVKYLDLGTMALANAFVAKKNLGKPEEKFPLRVYYCPNCHLAQLTDWVDRKKLFNRYHYFTGASKPLHTHFEQYAKEAADARRLRARRRRASADLVVDIGSNDGLLLKYFKQLGARVLGVDPAKNVAKQAKQDGIETLVTFFNEETAGSIAKKYGWADIITANNVLAHTDELHSIMAGVKKLLANDGVFVFEVQYLDDLVRDNEFDNTYHEHICYFSVHPLVTLLQQHNLEIFDIKRVDTQGGSLRVYAGHQPLKFAVQPSVERFLTQEKELGLQSIEKLKAFGKMPNMHRKELVILLRNLKKHGKKIIGYGAAAKGNTLLQYCNIGPKLLDYVADTTPSKQGTFTPGTNIPVMPTSHMQKNLPDYVLILAWNYASAIKQNESWLKDKGVKFITPIPHIEVS